MGWARGQILVHLENVVILLIKIASRQKAFILGQDVHRMLYFYSVASDIRFHARCWGQRSKFITFLTLVYQVFSRSSYLETTDQKAVILGPKVTWRVL